MFAPEDTGGRHLATIRIRKSVDHAGYCADYSHSSGYANRLPIIGKHSSARFGSAVLRQRMIIQRATARSGLFRSGG